MAFLVRVLVSCSQATHEKCKQDITYNSGRARHLRGTLPSGANELSSGITEGLDVVPALALGCLPRCRRFSEPSTLRRNVGVCQKRKLIFETKERDSLLKIRRSTLKEAKSNKSLRIWYEVNDGVEEYHDIQFSEM